MPENVSFLIIERAKLLLDFYLQAAWMSKLYCSLGENSHLQRLIGKDSDAGREWGQEEKGTTEDEMAGWHH